MSRGGRGGKRGPDMSWDDEEPVEVLANSKKPGPMFPDRHIPTPKPLTASEKSSVSHFINIRDRIRRGPLYATLDPTLITSSQTKPQTSFLPNQKSLHSSSKPNSRAGFDPFTDQEKYTTKYHRERRAIPNLTERGGYTLRMFPMELWPSLDPKRRMKEWDGLTDDQKARISSTTATTRSRKRKQKTALKFDDEEDVAAAGRESASEKDEEEEEEDVVSPTAKRRRKEQRGVTRQKKGLDAEDDYPDVEQDEDGEGGRGAGGVDDEPHDSEFETDEGEDDGADDYNAEQYFDDGADDMDGGMGDDGDGDGGGYY